MAACRHGVPRRRARRVPRVRAGRARAGLRVGLRRGGVRRRARQRGHDQPDGALLQPGGHRARRGHAPVRERRARAAPRELVAHASGVRDARAAGRRGGGHRAGALLQSVRRAGAGGDDLDPPARAGRRVLRPVRRAGALGSEPALRERPDLSAGCRRRAALAHHRGRGDVALLHGGRRAPPRARRARRDRQPGSIVGAHPAGQELQPAAGRRSAQRGAHRNRRRRHARQLRRRGDDRSRPRAPVARRFVSGAAGAGPDAARRHAVDQPRRRRGAATASHLHARAAGHRARRAARAADRRGGARSSCACSAI